LLNICERPFRSFTKKKKNIDRSVVLAPQIIRYARCQKHTTRWIKIENKWTRAAPSPRNTAHLVTRARIARFARCARFARPVRAGSSRKRNRKSDIGDDRRKCSRTARWAYLHQVNGPGRNRSLGGHYDNGLTKRKLLCDRACSCSV